MKTQSTRRHFLGLAGSALAATQLQSRILAAQLMPGQPALQRSHTLWFDAPAPQWADALPLGNGRLGAMVFGGARSERIALNEDTLWSGGPKDWNNPRAKEHLPIVRRLVMQDQNYIAADQEARKMQGPFNDAYEPLGDLVIEMDHADTVTNYRRELNLDMALAKVSYEVGGVQYTRESFVSHPAQVLMVRLTARGGTGLNGTVRLTSQMQSKATTPDDRTIHLTGKAPSVSLPNYLSQKDPIRYSDKPGEGMYFVAALRATATGGTVVRQADGSLTLRGASSAVLMISMATGYKGYATAPDIP